MPTFDVSFDNKLGHHLSGIVRHPADIYLDEEGKWPVLIVLHGFNEHKEHSLYRELASRISPYGFVTLRLDFHGHGESGGSFDEHTITQQIDDVVCAVDFLTEQKYVDASKIAVFGHEIGGDVAILAAERDQRINCLILQGARDELEKHMASHFVSHDIDELERTGYVEHHDYGIKKQYLQHLRHHDILESLKKVQVPVLIVHGIEDLRVRLPEAKALFGAANDPKAYEYIDGADHWFRNHRDELVDIIATWLRRWFK